MLKVLATAWDTCIGLVMLGGLWLKPRLRGRRGYWDWRWQTAFGRGVPPRSELIRAIIRYAQWTARMRRLG